MATSKQREYQKKWSKQRKKQNPEAEKAAWTQARNRRAERLRKWKDVPCKDCGNKFPPECMDFDHLGEDKTGHVSVLNRTRSEAVVLAEIAKCDIVCANCHRIRTHQRKLRSDG